MCICRMRFLHYSEQTSKKIEKKKPQKKQQKNIETMAYYLHGKGICY